MGDIHFFGREKGRPSSFFLAKGRAGMERKDEGDGVSRPAGTEKPGAEKRGRGYRFPAAPGTGFSLFFRRRNLFGR